MKHITISDAEWHVMNLIWDKPDSTAQELCRELGPIHNWAEGTIKSLLNRLVKKGALSTTREGARFRYRAAVDREQLVDYESTSLMDRVFGGSASALVSHFVKQGKLNKNEIAELRAMIDQGES